MGLISISNHKKVTWTKFERNPLENKSLEILISETLIRGTPLVKLLSRLPECPNQLTYFTNIIFFVSKLSFSVKKLKKSQMGKKLWLLEVTVNFFLELVLFNDVSIFFNFSKIIFLSGWVFQNGKNTSVCKNSESYLQNYLIKNNFFGIPNFHLWDPWFVAHFWQIRSHGFQRAQINLLILQSYFLLFQNFHFQLTNWENLKYEKSYGSWKLQ